jgi:wyosine [tRNA(Phe)-imidazoG37] synthetase (radical SAM superfamily)
MLDLQKGVVYGPVHSRRLGSSLGINLLPAQMKVCTFNCLYCQYGWTDFSRMNKIPFPDFKDVLDAVEKGLKELPSPPSFITFSGNGEPTLHPRFPELVDRIIKIRDSFSPTSKTAILSNSSTVFQPEIQEALCRLDVRIMKLDAGGESIFQQYNQPLDSVSFSSIVDGLASLKQVIIQALFSGGPLGNSHEKLVNKWIYQVQIISPLSVQIYSLDRGKPSGDIEALTRQRMLDIQEKLKILNIKSDVY